MPHGRVDRSSSTERGDDVRDIPPASEKTMPARKRETIDSGTSKRYVRRDAKGQFTTDQVDAGKSSAADQRQHSKTSAKHGQADRGDRSATR